MRKVKSSASYCLHQCVGEFSDVFICGKVLLCQTYGNSVVAQQRSSVTQHLNGSKHMAAFVGLKDLPGRQSLNGGCSATSYSSGPFKFATFKNICTKQLCPQT